MNRPARVLLALTGLSTRFRVYQALSGDDLPLYVVVEGGRSEVDYHQNAESIRAALGEDGFKLIQKALGVIRRVETMTAVPRPDLSYPPPHSSAN